jgi:hypothetical protein
MYEKINLLKCMSAILFFFILGLASICAAGDCGDCEEPPTFPGNASRCDGTKPTINVTFTEGMDTIDSSNPVILSANGGCPPYEWSTISKGYILTNNEDGSVTLSVISGACGTDYDVNASLTVINGGDPAGSTIKEIRNTAGKWVYHGYAWSKNGNCSGYNSAPLITCPNTLYEKIDGIYKWIANTFICESTCSKCTSTWFPGGASGWVEPPFGPCDLAGESNCPCIGNDLYGNACSAHARYCSFFIWECS